MIVSNTRPGSAGVGPSEDGFSAKLTVRPVPRSGGDQNVTFPSLLLLVAGMGAGGTPAHPEFEDRGVRPESIEEEAAVEVDTEVALVPRDVEAVAVERATLPGDTPVIGGESQGDHVGGDWADDNPAGPVSTAVFSQRDTVELSPDRIRGLDPRFVTRLRRVTERMATEHDIRVDVIEGVRTRARQMELYAQGRTAPGPVVTWTTNSLHLDGLAADVRLNGEPPVGEPARLFSRIAREEGLRTLYPFDSGHIELPGVRRSQGPEARTEGPAPALLPGAAPRPTGGVAVPAPVARPARPAALAVPGGADVVVGPKGTDPAAEGPRGPVADLDVPHGESAPTLGSGSVRASEVVAGGRWAPGPPREHDVRSSRSEGASPGDAGDGLWGLSFPHASGSAGTQLVDGLGASAGSGRTAAHVAATLEWAELSRTATQSVQVPIRDGASEGSIRVGLRQGQVFAEVRVPDAALVDRLARNVNDLRRGLVERGLDVGAITVRVAQTTASEPGPAGLDTEKRLAHERGNDDRRGDPGADPRTDRERRDHRNRGSREEGRQPERSA